MTTTSKLPISAQARKMMPMGRGLIDYFPLALGYVSFVSKIGNDQHNPGEPMHWARGKSTDHADCIMRHLAERGTVDVDWLRHSGKLAWRALANLQEELETILPADLVAEMQACEEMVFAKHRAEYEADQMAYGNDNEALHG